MLSRQKMTVVLFAAILFYNCITSSVFSQEAKSDEKKSTTQDTVSEKQLETWIDQLSEGNFRERRNASNNLLKVGKQALSALVKGAQKNDAERSARCVDIITRMYKGKDETLKTAAAKALTELEKSSNNAVAQRAQNATKKPEEIQPNPFGNFQIQLNGNAVQVFQRMNVNGNGDWSKTISENGKTTAIEKKNGAITIKVTEKIKGKDKTTVTKAKNEAELKKKNPALFKLYKKQNQLQNPLNLAFGNLNLKGRNIVIGAPAGGAWNMRQQIVNGKRKTTVNENGKKINIEDRSGKDILIEVTETVKGKEQTKTYKAKDVKELKKKHPEIAKLYEKHTKQNGANALFGGIQVRQLQGIPAQVQRGVGGGRFILPAFPGQAVKNANDKKIKAAEKKISDAFNRLDEMAKAKKFNLKRFKSLNAEIQKLRNELKKLRK